MKPELAKVGPAWDGGDIEKWPGVDGRASITNHLAYNNNPFLPDPIDSSSARDNLVGGKKTRKGRNTRKGVKKSKGKRMKRTNKPITKKRRVRKYKKQRGGGHHGKTLLPQSLVNLGRNTQYNVEGWWNAFTGSQGPVDPDPSVQPIGL